MTTIYWVPRDGQGRLGLMPRPRGADWLSADIESLREQAVDVLVSALTDWEMEELDLTDQLSCCEKFGIDFWRFPVFDRSIPSQAAGLEMLGRIMAELALGKSVVIHCRLGIGRSGILAAGTLIMEGERPAVAINRVSRARQLPIPDTDEQTKWLFALGSKLGKNGPGSP